MRSQQQLFGGIGLLVLLSLAGCGNSSNVVEVTGVLTHKGSPVPNALIHFEPEHGRMSWAQTDAEGKFKINYDAHQDGAVIGKHKVWLEMRATSAADQEAVMLGKQPKTSKDLAALFDKYSGDNSKLSVEIKPDTKELKLDLE